MNINKLLTFFILFMIITLLTGCNETPGQKEEGTIRVSGAWALYPMMVKWAEEFQKIHPSVRIDVSAGGAGKGVTDALSGMVDIGMVSRDIKKEEIEKGAFYIPLVKDAVFPTINEKNPLIEKDLLKKGVKKQVIVDLWIKGKSMTWGEVSGTDCKDKIQVYTRSDACGAAEIWAKYLGGDQEDLKGIAVYGDPGLTEAVSKDPAGTGYNNLGYAYDIKTGLPIKGIRILPLDLNENGKIDEDEDLSTKDKAMKAIISGVYPSPPARNLYIISKEKFNGISEEFVRWILTDGQKYVVEAGYINLQKEQIRENLKKFGN
jgi:phosphate transport system substrate-binding protein